VLSPAVGIGASAVLVVLLGGFVVELQRDGDAIGLTERVVAGAQALWPLAVATTLARRRS